MSLFINEALAAAESGIAAGSSYTPILILGVFVLIFYFLLWRPQSKRAKEHRELVSKLAKGDEVMTNGGIFGTINNVTDDFIQLDIAKGVTVAIQKAAVAKTVPKGTLQSLV
ncbi:MAG: preprotein translocase subunit YajC [Gammaproteobacteria bacterium]